MNRTVASNGVHGRCAPLAPMTPAVGVDFMDTMDRLENQLSHVATTPTRR